MRFSWTQPCCDACWVDRYPIRVPVRIAERHRERGRCVYCNHKTRSGIYVRINPAEAPYPTLEKTS